MNLELTDVDLGFVENIKMLREVLAALRSNGSDWWLASDPADAIEKGYVTIGHGCQGCLDRLNTLYYRPLSSCGAAFSRFGARCHSSGRR